MSKESELRSEKKQTADISKEEEALEGPPIPYSVTITVQGGHAELKKLMEEASSLVVLAKKPPDSIFGIERRAKVDSETARKLLHAQCYYEGEASYTLNENAKPVAVSLILKPGPRYTVGRATVSYKPSPVVPESFAKRVRSYGLLGLDKEELPGPEFPKEIPGVTIGKPITADAMLAAVEAIPTKLHGKGYPLAKVTESLYTLNRETRELNADITVHPGPAATFGGVRVHGNKDVTASYIQNLIPWREKEEPWVIQHTLCIS